MYIDRSHNIKTLREALKDRNDILKHTPKDRRKSLTYQELLGAALQEIDELNKAMLKMEMRTPPAPTVEEVLGEEGYKQLVEKVPSYRDSGTPISRSDTAREVFWQAVRHAERTKQKRSQAEAEAHMLTGLCDELEAKDAAQAKQIEVYDQQLNRCIRALAEYAIRAVTTTQPEAGA